MAGVSAGFQRTKRISTRLVAIYLTFSVDFGHTGNAWAINAARPRRETLPGARRMPIGGVWNTTYIEDS